MSFKISKPKNLSLTSFIFLLIFFTLLIGSLITFFIIRSYTFEIIKKLEIEKVERLGESLRIQTIENLVVNQYDEIEKRFELYIKDGLIEGAILLSPDKGPIIYLSKDEKGEIVRLYRTLSPGVKISEKSYYDEKRAKYFFFSELKLKKIVFGYLILTFDFSKIRDIYWSTTILLASLYTIFLLFLLVLYHKIKKELESAIAFSKELPFKKGEFLSLSPFFVETKDLADSLNWASRQLWETERELIREKALMDGVLSTIDEAVFVLAPDFTIKYQNERAKELLQKLLGLGSEDQEVLKGLFLEGRFKAYPEGKALSLEELLENLKRGDRVELQVEVNGSVYELSLKRISSLEEHQDWLLSLKDITQRIRAQEEFLRTEKMKSLIQLAAGIAHDLNNVLAILFNTLNLMLLSKGVPEEIRGVIHTLERHLKMAKYLAFQLLSLSKGGEIILEKSDLEMVIKDTSSFALAGSKTKFYLDLKVKVKNLKSDPYALSQILMNLFINSVQAGAESITVKVDKTKEDERDYLLIVVSDDGPGIPSEILDKVFEPFFTTKKEGSGLGLYIVKSLVERLGGRLRVESRLGEGTTFYIYLPYETIEEERVEERALPLDRRFRILVVDDEEDLRESLALILKELGHEVITAGDGEEALSTFLSLTSQGKDIDLLITDFTMPGRLNGLELIKTLREFAPDLKSILSTGYAEVGEGKDLSKYDIVSVLRKPYTLEDLIKALNKA
jgi:signal transduction histidine kinase/CheY-like chemotaxis protein